MALNPDVVGSVTDPVIATWSSTDALLYAVGVGAGVNDLAVTTENTSGIEQVVLPTFAVTIGWGRVPTLTGIGEFDPALLVHSGQGVVLHRPIPVAGTATLVGRVDSMWDKGSAAVVETSTTASVDDEPLFTTTASVFIRGAGGWGGERGPAPTDLVAPDGVPHGSATMRTTPDQALIYRLSGDRNPLHSDPAFAARGGFDRPILHGLCSYGFTSRALLWHLCDGDPAGFKSMTGRFVSPVVPGDELTVRWWRVDRHRAVFTTLVGERVVIDRGGFEWD